MGPPGTEVGTIFLAFDAAKLAELADDERRLLVLKQIARDGGTVAPQWLAGDKRGYAYYRCGDASFDRRLDDDIKLLSRGDYITENFYERVTRCPSCSSHAVNVREVCPSCGSANLSAQPMLHHFRCGFVGPIELYGQDGSNQWQCPKCNRSLKNLGTDYEHAGDHYSCRNCFASFQEANAEGFCVNCQTKSDGASLDSEDVFSYRLSPLGAAAIRTGRLFSRDDEQMTEGSLPIYRRRVMISLMSDELRRKQRYKMDVTFLLVDVNYDCDPSEKGRREELFLKKLTDFLRDVDTAGRYDESSYTVNLPSTGLKGGQIAVKRMLEHFGPQASNINIELIDTDAIEDVPSALEVAHRKLREAS